MMARSPQRLLFIGTLLLAGLVQPVWADITVCIDAVEIEKEDAGPKDKDTLTPLNASLKKTVTEIKAHETLSTAAKKNFRDPLPLRFAQTASCIKLALQIRTSGTSLETQLVYNGRPIVRPTSFSSSWTFQRAYVPELGPELIRSAVKAVGEQLQDINKELLIRLVKEESEKTSLPPVKLEQKGVVCDEAESCAVLPALTLNDYLLISTFRLDITLAGLVGQRQVMSKGLGTCLPYYNNKNNDNNNKDIDFGIVVKYSPEGLPSRRWESATISLQELILLPPGTSCRAGVRPVVKPPPARLQ